MAITNEDVAACYDMSLKDFEHSGVHDLFKVCELLSLFFLFFFNLVLFVVYTCLFWLTKFNLCRQCLSSLPRLGRQQNWTRRGSRRLRMRARNRLRWRLRPKMMPKSCKILLRS